LAVEALIPPAPGVHPGGGWWGVAGALAVVLASLWYAGSSLDIQRSLIVGGLELAVASVACGAVVRAPVVGTRSCCRSAGGLMADQVVLGVDVGGSHVKVLVSAGEQERRRFESGPNLSPQQLLEGVKKETEDWDFDVVSMGIPAVVRRGRIEAEPVNLGSGWVGFDFQNAFGKPTKVVNDAAMQALGSYGGGKMLFLGLGTGLGSSIVVEQVILPMELGHLPFRDGTFEQYVGEHGRETHGKKKWEKAVHETIERLSAALEPDYVVLGGGNAKKLDELPPNARLGENTNAFVGAFRLWDPAMPDV
jgi:polyphosphate glucokinase